MFGFHAMGTDVAVMLPTLPEQEATELTSRVADLFQSQEECFSRFDPQSELSRLNRARDSIQVSTQLFAALTRARAYVDLTEGAFDPGIGASLAALGYDASFAPGRLDRDEPERWPERGSLREVRLDADTQHVLRPAHVQLDLGGMVKGETVDAAMQLLPTTAAVDAGGDAVLRGAGADGAGWLVEVEDPYDARRTLLTLRVRDRAIATSSANRRHWRLGRGEAHHLIDPRTGRSAHSDLAQVTVLAPQAGLCDVLAKSAFLLGSAEALHLFERVADVAAVLVKKDGSLLKWGALEACGD